MPTIIDKLYSDNVTLLDYLSAQGEVSLRQIAEESFRKALVLSAASYFEYEIVEALRTYAVRRAGADECILAMLRTRVLSRQYHTFFDWPNRRVGPFYGLLGDVIGTELKQECSAAALKTAVDAFLELGNLRNELVHQNFAGYAFEKTTKEVYELYNTASKFVNLVAAKLTQSPPIEELQQKIRQRAYEIYVNRGRQEGYEVDDWVQAEAEMLGR